MWLKGCQERQEEQDQSYVGPDWRHDDESHGCQHHVRVLVVLLCLAHARVWHARARGGGGGSMLVIVCVQLGLRLLCFLVCSI